MNIQEIINIEYDPHKLFLFTQIEEENVQKDKGNYKVAFGFKRDDLLYDIKNTAYVIANVMRIDDENTRHQIFDICEKGNIDIVTKTINLAFYEMCEIIRTHSRRRIKIEATGGFVFDTLDTYAISMLVPGAYQKHEMWLLRNLTHWYIVYRVFEEFLKIVAHPLYKQIEENSITIKDKVEETLKGAGGSVSRRPLRPF